MRWWLLCVAACSKDVPDGVSGVHLELAEHTVAVRYTVKLAAKPAHARSKVACQVGADRFAAGFDGWPEQWVAGEAIEVHAAPSFLSSFPGRPTQCELTILGERFCATEASTVRGACAANPVSGPASHGLSARLVEVVPEAASGGFPPLLEVDYVITAHEDPPEDAEVVRTTTCNGNSDHTSHALSPWLRTGESLYVAMNNFHTGRAAGVLCKTTFGFQQGDAPIDVIGEACHVDDRIVPCP